MTSSGDIQKLQSMSIISVELGCRWRCGWKAESKGQWMLQLSAYLRGRQQSLMSCLWYGEWRPRSANLRPK